MLFRSQPAIPQVDEEGEKTNPPTTAGEQANASKEAKGAEAVDVNLNAKANEVAEAKKASEDTEKKAKAKKRSAVEAKNLSRVYEAGEPSTRMPKDYPRTDKDEWNLLTTPIPKDESAQMMELRRIALLPRAY